MHRFFIVRTRRVLGIALLAAAILVHFTGAAARAEDPILAAQRLADHAIRGDFAGILDLLQQQDHLRDPSIQVLIAQLQQYQQHVAEHTQTQKQAYRDARVKVAETLEEGKIEETLIAAIDAHSLADDPPAVLRDPMVLKAVAVGKTRAIAAEESGNWVEALNLYRELDLLFSHSRMYRDSVKRVAKHVRVLRLYAPKKLETLYHARAVARGDDKPSSIEPESWKIKLRGIKLSMLQQTLSQSASDHVNGGGYLPLMQGAVRSLSVLLHTDALRDEFEGFKDPDKLTIFQDELDRLTAQLNEPDKQLNNRDVANIVDRIFTTNKETLALPDVVIIYELAEGATDTLDDFSSVIWPEEKARFRRSTQGTFYGVGIQIRREERLVVVSPLPNTPAQRAGIKAGDIIAQVDGVSTDAWSLEHAVRKITGPLNSTVILGIERDGEKELLQLPIQRGEIAIESILGWQRDEQDQWDYWIDRDAGVGYVRMMQFLPQTAGDLDTAIAKLTHQHALNGLILDLRFNPGGLLSSATDVSDRFISQGTIVSTVTAEGQSTHDPILAQKCVTYPRFPVVVLINQGSASASEIVSGALQDYGRALIVGERSFGKGSVQDLFPLDYGRAYLKLTTQYYMLPRGRIIHRRPDAQTWGIEPDLTIPMTDRQVADALEYRQEIDVIYGEPEQGQAPADEDAKPRLASDLITQGIDPQLEAALLLLKTQLVVDQIALARKE